jgi:hypothetical protein
MYESIENGRFPSGSESPSIFLLAARHAAVTRHRAACDRFKHQSGFDVQFVPWFARIAL